MEPNIIYIQNACLSKIASSGFSFSCRLHNGEFHCPLFTLTKQIMKSEFHSPLFTFAKVNSGEHIHCLWLDLTQT